MTKINEFYEEEMSGEPLTEEKVKWALEKFANLAYSDGYLTSYMISKGVDDDSTYQEWLNKPYSEREQEFVNFKP